MMVTPDVFRKRLVDLGLPLDHGGDFYGYSLALGSADVTLLSLTHAYRALANLGRYSRPELLAGSAQSDIRQGHNQCDAGSDGDILKSASTNGGEAWDSAIQ